MKLTETLREENPIETQMSFVCYSSTISVALKLLPLCSIMRLCPNPKVALCPLKHCRTDNKSKGPVGCVISRCGEEEHCKLGHAVRDSSCLSLPASRPPSVTSKGFNSVLSARRHP